MVYNNQLCIIILIVTRNNVVNNNNNNNAHILDCLLRMRGFCRGYRSWWIADLSWTLRWARRARSSVHQDYGYIATTPGTVRLCRYSLQPRHYPGMSTSAAGKPHYSPPCPTSALLIPRSATSLSMPGTRNAHAQRDPGNPRGSASAL